MAFGDVRPHGEVAEDLSRRGYHLFPEPVDPAAAAGLLAEIKAIRAFDQGLFLSETEFLADPQYRGVNPRPGRNLLERFADRDIRGHLLQVLDPAEVAMPFLGRVRFRGLEREGEILMSRVETVREAYLNKLAAHQDELRHLARLAGWSFSVHTTDAPGAPALLALYQWLAADKRFHQ